MLDKKVISSMLPGTAIVVYDITDSTNTRAIELAKSVKGNILVAAEGQTSGKGRQGKSFYSPAGSGVYFSIVIRPDGRLSDVVFVTSAVAVAVAKTIEEMTDLDPKIKWVNDIYVNDKKVCGILVQSIVANGKVDGLCIGIGVNISTADFPDTVGSRAGSLGEEIDRNVFVAKVTKKMIAFSADIEDRTYLDYYRKKSCVIGREIKYYENNVEHFAKVIAIDDNANLIVSENGETKKLSSGEITVRF
ncbi:MAG TPA: biotin--[acetyl-CoA-carboxylase] ligase [Ruminococcaceae bacterium]|nr:biotin--[acetyl-CoA-carboxylase] ligase [Oscillospiraceae bacterium]